MTSEGVLWDLATETLAADPFCPVRIGCLSMLDQLEVWGNSKAEATP